MQSRLYTEETPLRSIYGCKGLFSAVEKDVHDAPSEVSELLHFLLRTGWAAANRCICEAAVCLLGTQTGCALHESVIHTNTI